MSEDFLSRWSRRKREAQKQEREPPPPEAADAEPPAAVAAPEGTAPQESAAAAPEAELSEEEIARLPSLDELTAETDITAFLRKGVPERLRNAALRRMWSLDPTIRDFVSEAREYAYDWNTPDSIPGFGGALPPPEEVQKLAARIVGAFKPDSAHTAEAEPPAQGEQAVSQNRESSSAGVDVDVGAASQRHAIAPEPSCPALPPPRAETSTVEAVAAATTKVAGAADPAAGQQSDARQELKLHKARRHGGAKPL